MPANMETPQWPQDWKMSVFIPIPKKGNTKECSNYCTIAFISHASTVMLKILQGRLQQNMNHELPDVQAGFRKGRGTRDQIANILCIIEKAREFQKKHLLLLCWLCQSLWLCGSHGGKFCGKFFKNFQWKKFSRKFSEKLWKILQEMRMPDHLTCLLRNLYADQEATFRTGHETNRLVPNWERSMSRLYIVTLLV